MLLVLLTVVCAVMRCQAVCMRTSLRSRGLLTRDVTLLPRAALQGNYIEAELAVGFQLFAERYISRVTLEQDRRVLVRAVGCRLRAHTHMAATQSTRHLFSHVIDCRLRPNPRSCSTT